MKYVLTLIIISMNSNLIGMAATECWRCHIHEQKELEHQLWWIEHNIWSTAFNAKKIAWDLENQAKKKIKTLENQIWQINRSIKNTAYEARKIANYIENQAKRIKEQQEKDTRKKVIEAFKVIEALEAKREIKIIKIQNISSNRKPIGYKETLELIKQVSRKNIFNSDDYPKIIPSLVLLPKPKPQPTKQLFSQIRFYPNTNHTTVAALTACLDAPSIPFDKNFTKNADLY